MRMLRMVVCLFLVLLAMSVNAGFRDVPSASATTGPSEVPALYKVPRAFAEQFLGQFTLKSVTKGSRISQAQMLIDFNSLNYLSGVISFRGYDSQGYQITWVADMYNFRQTTAGMRIPLLGPGINTPQFGTLYLRPTKKGDLVGQLALGTKHYAIQFHRTLKL
ncbi:MAG TPA: hypothetical protein VIJ28_20620 [Chloroflexota bacterium]